MTTTTEPAPLLALSSPTRSHPRRQLFPRRIFGRQSLLGLIILAFSGSFIILWLLHRDNYNTQWRWSFPAPFNSHSHSQSHSTGPPVSISGSENEKEKEKYGPLPFTPHVTTSEFHPISYPLENGHDVQTMSISDLCASFPHNITQNRIQPVLKIGHGENPAILSAQLNSVSACFEPGELLIFSDMDADLVVRTNNSDSVSGVHVHKAIDILATLPKAYYQHKDFAAYNTLQEMIANNTPITAENDPTRSRRDSDKLNTGWKLDKYKFLAGVERAWEMRPNREWYIFYETDTYISWDGLFRLLLTQNGAFDPDKEIYLGSPSPGRLRDDWGAWINNQLIKAGLKKGDWNKIRRTWFANGGPGFVLSRGAMRRLLARKAENGEKGIGVGMGMTRGWFEEQSLTEKWMTAVQGDCCGDSVLGWALWKAGVKLGGLFPMFNVYPAHGVVYTEHMWCQPLVTLHKTTPRDMVELWRWEQGHRRLGRPILYADLYAFKNPGLLPGSSPSKSNNLNPRRSNDLLRPNWDNTAYDRLAPAHDVHAISPAQCAVECDKDPACLQYLHRGETCVLMPYIVYGAEKLPEVNERNVTDESNPGGWRMETETIEFTAGWMGGRIKGWRREHECKEVDWLWPSLDRYF